MGSAKSTSVPTTGYPLGGIHLTCVLSFNPNNNLGDNYYLFMLIVQMGKKWAQTHQLNFPRSPR